MEVSAPEMLSLSAWTVGLLAEGSCLALVFGHLFLI